MSSRQNCGYTIAEALIGFALLSMLMTVMFLVYVHGAGAWKKVEAQTDLLQQAQVVSARLSRELEQSVYDSAALDPGPSTGTAVSFLSCWNEPLERFEYSSLDRSPIWQKHVVYYYDSNSQEVRRTEVPLAPPSTTAAPLAGVAAARTGGRVLARDVSRCDFTLTERVLEIRLELERKRYGSAKLETVELPSTVFFRN